MYLSLRHFANMVHFYLMYVFDMLKGISPENLLFILLTDILFIISLGNTKLMSICVAK